MSIESESGEDGVVEKTFSYFNYRVMLTDRGDCEIRDVYYGSDGEITGWGEPNPLVGLDLEDLALGVSYAAAAMARPLLVESELPGYLPLAPKNSDERDEVAPERKERLGAIVTSSCAPKTLGELETWAVGLSRYGLSEDTELLDGAQVHPEGTHSLLEYVRYPEVTRRISLGDLRAWITHLYADGVGAEAALLDAQDLAIDLPVRKVSGIACGNCNLLDVVVDIHEHAPTDD